MADMSDFTFNPAADSQAAYAAMPSGGLDTLPNTSSNSMSGLTKQQKLQMAQMAGQMLMKGFSGPAPSMGGPQAAPQNIPTQAPSAGQFIYSTGGRQ